MKIHRLQHVTKNRQHLSCNELYNELVQMNSKQNNFVLNENYRSEVETCDRHLVSERKCVAFNGRKPVNKTKKTS